MTCVFFYSRGEVSPPSVWIWVYPMAALVLMESHMFINSHVMVHLISMPLLEKSVLGFQISPLFSYIHLMLNSCVLTVSLHVHYS